MGEKPKDIFAHDGPSWPVDVSAQVYASYLVDAGFTDIEAVNLGEAMAGIDDEEGADIFIQRVAYANGYKNPIAEGRIQ